MCNKRVKQTMSQKGHLIHKTSKITYLPSAEISYLWTVNDRSRVLQLRASDFAFTIKVKMLIKVACDLFPLKKNYAD